MTRPVHTPSPCVAICELNADDICTGCMRSLDEIGDWGSASERRRQQILDNAQVRLAELSNT